VVTALKIGAGGGKENVIRKNIRPTPSTPIKTISWPVYGRNLGVSLAISHTMARKPAKTRKTSGHHSVARKLPIAVKIRPPLY